MLFFYLRHGDPIYNPDSLTPLGERQALALSKRLARYGIDKIYASTSARARLTAKPTCELLHMEAELLDFAREDYAWDDLGYKHILDDGSEKYFWLFYPTMLEFLCSPEILSLGEKWYEHPRFAQYNYKAGLERIRNGADKLFASHGFEHIRGTGTYRASAPNDERIALFAHQGFGLAFLSCVLDIPYPKFITHFDLCHSSMTVLQFRKLGKDIYAPTILTSSNDSHIYAEGLPTNYNNEIRF